MNVLLKSGKLLDDQGELISSGFAFDLVKEYRKSDVIHLNKLKEINRYYIFNDVCALSLVISSSEKVSYMDVCFDDFENDIHYSRSRIKYFEQSRVVMTPSSKTGSIEFMKKDFSVEVYNNYTERRIIFAMKNIAFRKDFYCAFTLTETTNGTSVVACKFEENNEFLYNQKINCIKANGYCNIGSRHYEFKESNSRACIDWIRAVFPKRDISYDYASASGLIDNIEAGFVFSDGLGDTQYATSNMFFYDRHAFKLDEVVMKPTSRLHTYTRDWEISSSDEQVELTFSPIDNTTSNVSTWYEKIGRRIIYGKFNGFIMFDQDKIEIKDLMGFIEINNNKY